MTNNIDSYAKINSVDIVIGIQLVDPNTDTLDSNFTWVNLTNVTCSDGTPVVPGCTYDGTNFTSLPKDAIGRTVIFESDGTTDTYYFFDPYGTDGQIQVASGTTQGAAYSDIDAQVPTLLHAIQSNLIAFNAALLQYTDSVFVTDTKLQFFILYYLAVQGGLTNRAAYIQPLLTWASSFISYASAYAATVQSQSTVAEVYATTWNFPANTLSIPNITLVGAINITN